MAYAEMLPAGSGEPDLLAADAHRAFWLRALAVAIDSVVLSVITFAVDIVFGVTHVTSGSPVPDVASGFTGFTSATDVGSGWLILLWLVYYIGLEALFGATIGKWAVRLRVTNLNGRRAGFGAIAARNVLRFVDGLPVAFLLGGSVALGSLRRQRIGDHLARTLVIPRDSLAAPLLAPTQLHRRLALASGVIVACLTVSALFFYYGRPPLVVRGMMNTRTMMFRDGVSSYSLSAPVWGPGTVSYQIAYVTERPVDRCHARLTLAWSLPVGWEPRYGDATCDAHTP